MSLRQGTRCCASDVVGLRSRATGVVRLQAVAAFFACSGLIFPHVFTSYERATPDARERIPTGAGGSGSVLSFLIIHYGSRKKLYRRPEIIQHKCFQFSYSKFRHSNHRIGSQTCANHTVPYGTALLGWRCPRHFVPGYDRAVPPGHFVPGF
jgi:hypothetical protein